MPLSRARIVGASCLLAGLLVFSAPSYGQSDPLRTRDRDVSTSIKVYPSPIWSRTAGFSAGLGYEIENFPFPRGRILATAKPGQHLGQYTLTYFARDAYLDPVYGLINAYYEKTGRHWFYGLGPNSSRDDEIGVELSTFEAELRIGVQPFDRLIFLQPSVKFIRNAVHGFENFDEGAFDRISLESRRNLLNATGIAPGSDDVQEGFAVGGAVGLDLRDRPLFTRRGVLLQALAHRYHFGTSPDIEYDRYEIYGYAFLPVRSNVLILRVVTKLTDPRSETPIPFYLLPTLHGRLLPGYSWQRFVGQDLFVASLEYAVPIFNLFEYAALDGLITAGVGNVYNDLFDEFKPAVSFKSDLGNGPEYALRPSIAAGLHFETYSMTPWSFRVLLGWGTEGIMLVRFGFIHDLRGIELGQR